MRYALPMLLMLAACSRRPAHYADQPPLETVRDNRPIPLPGRTPFMEATYLSDVYLRRPIVDALDIQRYPYAKDVNARDEVPRSSWFDPWPVDPANFENAYTVDGPPVAPVRVERKSGAWRLTDSRGKTYVLEGDVDRLPATTTAAAIIASRLIRAFGYRAAEAWLIDRKALGIAAKDGPAGERLTATRWPVGVELGPTDMTSPRNDDPNDRISHRDRRSLRALGVLAAWLDLHEIGPQRLIDVYVGRPGLGHVQHYVVDVHDALGAGRTGSVRTRVSSVGTVRGSPWTNLFTFGLARPRPGAGEPEKSLRVLSPNVSPKYALAEPYEPIDRLQAPDGYWAAKRIDRISKELIEAAVAAARIEDAGVARHVVEALEARKNTLVSYWFAAVTPCEPEGVSARTLVMRDVASERDASERRYRVELIGEDGDVLSPPRWLTGAAGKVEIPLPELEPKYVVIRVTVERAGKLAPRAMEVHLIQERGTPRVVGVRH